MNTLKSWGVMANGALFLGDIEKGKILGVLKSHIFFDDQPGISNRPAQLLRLCTFLFASPKKWQRRLKLRLRLDRLIG